MALAVAVGCSNNTSSGPAPEKNVNESWADLNPPDNVNIDDCSGVVDNGSSSRVVDCSDCCNTNGYALGTLINQGKCACAATIPPNATLCATNLADSQVCNNCCLAANYDWSDFTSGVPPTCSCDMYTDRATCKNTVTRTEPADQCSLCCLNHGFINARYAPEGVPECACS